MTIREAKLNDTPQIATLHLTSLPLALVSKLGTNVIQAFYIEMIKNDDCSVFVYENNNLIKGATANTLSNEKLFALVKKNHFFTVAFAFLKRPHLIPLIFTGSYPTKLPEELLFLFVSPETKGKGLSKELVLESAKWFKQKERTAFKVTFGSDNERAKAFYKKMGFQKISEFTENKVKKEEYVYSL